MSIQAASWIPWLPLIGAALCGLCCTRPEWRKAAAPISIASIVASFLITLGVAASVKDWSPDASAGDFTATVGAWIGVGGFQAEWSYFIDKLTLVMLLVVTGIGSLIAIYASGYMAGEKGYARFFAAVSLFIFAMTTLVMADNLLLLFLGWEGVGLASYLLIGYYFDKPSAAAAAKKAFVVNRIGDAGFLLGIFCLYQGFGSIRFTEILPQAAELLHHGQTDNPYLAWAPFFLMLGAFGKSAQIPLYTWLPDAMEGPTPVSALIHAATMVTSGVYLLARLIPVFQLAPGALETIAVVAGLTSLVAALIALNQNDLKKVFAYSTVSQLGYMFLGIAALSTVGAVFHLVTHAFFKALLFLTAGNVMHALAGNLDLRTMSGLGKKLPITKWLMLAGCLALAAFPLSSGFFSKDTILAAAVGSEGVIQVMGWLGLVTAFLTASYAFRVWFRVFTGEERYEMGDEHHGDEHADDGHHAHEPHEMPWLMNGPLVILAVGALAAGFLGVGSHHGWIGGMIEHSTAAVHAHGDHHPELLGLDLHTAMMIISCIVSLSAIGLAYFLHTQSPATRDSLADAAKPALEPARNKFFVDEFYDIVFVNPLRFGAVLLSMLDKAVTLCLQMLGALPVAAAAVVRPTQSGRLQGYALGMAWGVAILAALVLFWLGTEA